MPVISIPVGPPTALTQNVVYAMPARQVVLFTDSTTPTIQQSNTSAFTANVAVTLTAGQATLAGGFLKATTSGVTVRLIKP